jgi:hypothetical protein
MGTLEFDPTARSSNGWRIADGRNCGSLFLRL